MKKKIRNIAIVLLIVIGLLLCVSGGKMAGIMLIDYSIPKDSNVMTLNVGVSSSMGFVRKMKSSQNGNKKYITFYSTYGLNSSIGSKEEFQVELQPYCDEIYFYSGNDEFKLRLQKNKETNEWERVK